MAIKTPAACMQWPFKSSCNCPRDPFDVTMPWAGVASLWG